MKSKKSSILELILWVSITAVAIGFMAYNAGNEEPKEDSSYAYYVSGTVSE